MVSVCLFVCFFAACRQTFCLWMKTAKCCLSMLDLFSSNQPVLLRSHLLGKHKVTCNKKLTEFLRGRKNVIQRIIDVRSQYFTSENENEIMKPVVEAGRNKEMWILVDTSQYLTVLYFLPSGICLLNMLYWIFWCILSLRSACFPYHAFFFPSG